MRHHYPRTPHLPWSPGASSNDVRAGELAGLVGREIVVTEKLDGENTTLYADGSHARSLDSAHHPSRARVKALQGRIAPGIPAGWRVCGENLFARHSIAYRDLAAHFYAFSVWDDRDRCLDWDTTARFARRLGVPVPAVLWRGVFDERALRRLRLDTARQEGYVVRTAAGFGYPEFGRRVAKWVRPAHVTTDTHWTRAPVVPNGLGPDAPLWEVRSGGPVDVAALAAVPGVTPEGDAPAAGAGGTAEDAARTVGEVVARLDLAGRTGEARLAGVLATLAVVSGARRERLAARAAGRLGMPLARRVADLVGLRAAVVRPYPDEERAAGLRRMAVAADLGVLHAVAAGCAAGAGAAAERERAEWSALHAEEAGLAGPDPLAGLRDGLRAALDGVPPDAADLCWARAREAFAAGRIRSVAEAAAATWRFRSGAFPRLLHLVGPSGSGKSRFAAVRSGGDETVSLDELRAARGGRADQRGNSAALSAGLDRLAAALAAGRGAVWDATSLNRHQRAQVTGLAARYGALVTQAVLLVDDDLLAARNADRPHPVPAGVLAAQLARFAPPYPGEAHRTWYAGADGGVADVAGTIDAEEW